MIIYSDIHYYGADPKPVIGLPQSYEEVLATNSVSIGDNYDLRYAALDQVEQCSIDLAQHRAMFKERYVSGNHDLTMERLLSKVGSVLITHGDWYITWGLAQSKAFRTQSAGAGRFSRALQYLSSKFRTLTGASLSKEDLQRVVMLARINNCQTVVFGHIHCKSLISKEIEGVKIFCVPRGRTELAGV